MKKIGIVGGGPAGIFCAIKIFELNENADIMIFDMAKPLSTLLVTGNGRCNLAYSEYNFKELASNYPRGEKFLYSVFSRYGLADTIADFEKIGVSVYSEGDLRIFPKENSARYVREKMLNAAKNAHFKRAKITSPLENFDAVILATGLKSGAQLAASYGHKIIPLRPALCGLKIKEKEFLVLEGVSHNGVIFTKQGVSGPYIYKISSKFAYEKFPYEIKIPLLNADELFRACASNPKKLFKNIVSNFIPKSLAELLVKGGKQCANTSKKEIEEMSVLKLTATGTDGKGEIVHAGGVCLDEIDKNFKSKLVPNLWIIGELLNIDGLCGGFNLQNCWSSAAIAAEDVVSRLYLAP